MKNIRFIGFVMAVSLLTALLTIPAAAHEGREVGDYEIELGWLVEPAYTTLLNGAELTITNHKTDTPVEGAEDTLKLEVRFGPSSKILKLRSIPNEPGHYSADLIPTQPGDYIFQVTGTIGDTPVDETFSATDGQFSSVDPISDIQFP
ncbi:MAG: hypothetical protein R3E39_00860 [Anaerolineae bacterium]